MTGANQQDEFVLSDAEFRMFAELVRSHCGLHFSEDSRFLLEKRLARRLRELDIGSFAAYHFRLRNQGPGDNELSKLIDELTTNETYFFRESGQLRALIHEIFPELQADRSNAPVSSVASRGSERAKSRPINIWCAGCSSGEEPYSIAIMAREVGIRPGVDLRVYASDISTRALRKARQGIYREASFRETDVSLRDKYFVEKDQLWQISNEIKKDVDFIHLNLMDRSKIALLGAMDVILCRNVIIYFNADTKCHVIKTFYEKLRPGGHLLLGHSESLINLSTEFELRHLRNDLVYRRPLPGFAAKDPWHVAAESAIAVRDDAEVEEAP
jgi:chemotaxis protein methyltransferase CheR